MGTAFSFRQTINGAAVELRNFIGRGGDLRIPPYFRSLPVTRIREGSDGFYLFAPMAFAINMAIGTIYFRFARKKMDHAKFLVCLVTLAITVILFFLMRA